MASANNKLSLVKMFKNVGADLNAVDDYGQTALMLAAHNEHVDVVDYLIENGVDVNIINNRGNNEG